MSVTLSLLITLKQVYNEKEQQVEQEETQGTVWSRDKHEEV